MDGLLFVLPIVCLTLLAAWWMSRTHQARLVSNHQGEMLDLLDHCPIAFIEIDEHGLVVFWSSAAARTFGWEKHEATGKLLAVLIVPPDWRDEHTRALQALRDRSRDVRRLFLDVPALCRDGQTLQVRIHIWSHRFNGRTYCAFVEDMTREFVEQVRVGAQLLEMQARLVSLESRLDNSKSGLFTELAEQLRLEIDNDAKQSGEQHD